jgi:hypothetical protein
VVILRAVDPATPPQPLTGTLPRIGTALTAPNLGWVMCDIWERLELPPMYFWQHHLSEVSTQVDVIGERRRLQYDRVGALVGRQSGKTRWSGARVLMQALLPDYDLTGYTDTRHVGPQHIAYLAQTRTSAVSRWEEHLDMFMRSPLSGRISRVSRHSGYPRMYFDNGSWYAPLTPSEKGPRGLDLDLAIIDEALTHKAELMRAVRPTMAQRDGSLAGIGAQLVVLSSAGDEESTLLQQFMELGRQAIGQPGARTCWLEWSADPDADHLDEEVWKATVPTLDVPNGITLDFLRSEAAAMGASDFLREYLCVFSHSGSSQVIPAEAWADCHRGDVILPASELVLGVDLSPDRQRAAIVAAGAVDEYRAVEVIESRSDPSSWLLGRLVEVAERWNAPVIIDTISPAASLMPALDGFGVVVVPVGTRGATDAAGAFYDRVLQRRIAHLGDWRLNDAVAGASKRAVGQRWAFDRRNSDTDISPLVAAALAVWGVETGQAGAPTMYT